MPLIPPETIEQIAAANDIVEVINGYFPLKKAGPAYRALCPFHQEKTPSFTVSPHRQMFKCFGCGAGGGVFRFVMDYEHIEFMAAARKLAERAGIRIVEAELSAEDQARHTLRHRLLELHAEAAGWFHQQLFKSQGAHAARDYLKNRGLGAEIAREWRLGYAPDSWDAFSGWARQRGYTEDELVQSGLARERDDEGEPARSRGSRSYDRFRNRVMFPICNDHGEVIAFSGRVLKADPKAAKYVNSPETILFTKGAVLFGLHRSKRALIDKQSAIVCEGQIDLIVAFQAGVQNVIAPQGTAFTEQQAHMLRRYVDEVVLCFDADAAGEKAAERSVALLLAENLSVRIVEMPPGEDPDSLIRTQGAAVFLERVAAAGDFFDFILKRLSARPDFATPAGRVRAARKVGGYAGMIHDAVLREAVMNRASQKLEISFHEFAKLVRAPARQRQESGVAAESAQAPLDPSLRLLALAALHDGAARTWLLEAPWKELLAREPDAAPVLKLLEANINSASTAALPAFLATLNTEEGNVVSALFEDSPPNNPLTIVQDCWNQIARRQYGRRIDSLKARLRDPVLTVEESRAVQKELVDLQKCLLDIPRPLSPPL